MCNGCQFLNTSLDMNSLETGDERFILYCRRYGIKAGGNYSKEQIKNGVTIFEACPSKNGVSELDPTADMLREFADELFDD